MNGRRSLRIPRFDYSASHSYFVTIVTMNRQCLFGTVAESLETNDAGRMVEDAWQSLGNRFAGLAPDTLVVMPNHLHGIINLDGAIADLGRIVGAFKSLTTLKLCAKRRRKSMGAL